MTHTMVFGFFVQRILPVSALYQTLNRSRRYWVIENQTKQYRKKNISAICAHLVCYNALVRPNKNKCEEKADATLNRIEVICKENGTLKPWLYFIFAHKSEPCIRTSGFSFPVNIPQLYFLIIFIIKWRKLLISLIDDNPRVSLSSTTIRQFFY